ncbi:MAG: DM13 domain-containing protein [Actinomycetota bacterium]
MPTDVDLTVFSTVEIWCERFGVGFGGAELMAA